MSVVQSLDRSIPETSCPGGGGDVFFIFCQQPVDDLVSLCPGHSLPRYRMAGRTSFATTEKYAHLAPDHLQGAVVNL
jgi:hypothetical protein